jgi:sugar O-acyltransferase (sialic acid O-acetyltransferase NeuD family)
VIAMRTLYVLGTSGFAKEVAQLASQLNQQRPTWESIAYLSEHEGDIGRSLPFGRVAGTDALLDELSEPVDVAIGVGHPQVRARLGKKLLANPWVTTPNLIHPIPGVDLDHVQMGKGNFVARGVAMTCDITIGDFNLFNYNCTIGHDVRIGSFNVVNPGSNVSGNCSIGDACLVGTGAQVLPGLSIASRSSVGAGAVVVRSVEGDGLTVVGIPARALKT